MTSNGTQDNYIRADVGDLVIDGSHTSVNITKALAVTGALTGTSATFSGAVTLGNNSYLSNATTSSVSLNSSGDVLLTAVQSGAVFAVKTWNGSTQATRLQISGAGATATTTITGLLSLANETRTLDVKLKTSPATGDMGVQFRAGSGDYLGLAAGGGTGIGIVIDDSNKVGIGTSAPSGLLDLYEPASGDNKLRFHSATTGTGTSNGSRIGLNGSELFINNLESSTIKIYTQSTQTNGICIANDGKVGVGTVTAHDKLHVQGNILQLDGSPEYHFGTTSASHRNWRVACQENVSQGFEIASGTTSAGTGAPSDTYTNRFVIKGATGQIQFNSYGGGTHTGTSAYKLSVDASGNIIETSIGSGAVDGSGTTNYISKWTDSDTLGNSSIHEGAAGSLQIEGPSAGRFLTLNAPTTGGYITFETADTAFADIGTPKAISGIATYSTTDLMINARSGAKNIVFGMNGYEKVRIDSNGRVGIGTNVPGTKLEIRQNGAFASGQSVAVQMASALQAFGGNNDMRLYFHEGGTTYRGMMGYAHAGSTYMGIWDSGSNLNPTLVCQTGKVGIGYDSPECLLDLKKSLDAPLRINLHNQSTNAAADATISFETNGQMDWGMGIDRTDGHFKIGRANTLGTNTVVQLDGSGTISAPSVFIDASDGKVGIGTTSPGAILDSDSNADWSSGWRNNLRLTSDYYPCIRFYSQTINKTSLIGNNNDGGLWFGVNGSGDAYSGYGMVIKPDGKVGIGTTAPGLPLEVKTSGSASTQYALSLTNPNNQAGDGGGAGIRFSTSGGPGAAGSEANKYSSIEAFDVNNWGSNSGLSFTTSLSYTKTKSMVIDRNGDVGIGTTGPSSKLHIYKTTNAFLNGLTIENPDAGSSASAGMYLNCNGKTLDMRIYNALSGNFGYINSSGTLYMGLYHDGGLVLAGKSGKVGIGTTAPSGAKLDVRTNSASLIDAGATVNIEEDTAWTQGLALYINNADVYNADYAAACIGVANNGSNIIITAGAKVVNNPASSNGYKTLNSTAPSVYRQMNGAHAFYGDTGKTANTLYTPTERMRIGADGKLSVIKNFVGSSVYANFGPTTLSGSGTREGGIQIHASSGVTDKTWGIWADANNPVGLRFEYLGARATAFGSGTNVLALDGVNNRVGIGTATPGAKLHVYGGNIRISSTDDKPQLEFFETAAARWVIGHSTAPNNYFAISEGSDIAASERLVIAPTTGKVGIGTTAPSSNLHVNYEISVGTDDDNRSMFGYQLSNSRFYLGTRQAGANYFDTVSVTTGKVGIGVADPDAKLEIKGAGGGTGLTFKTTDVSDNENFYIMDGGRTGVRFFPLTIGIPSGTSNATHAALQVEESGIFTVLSAAGGGKVGVGTTAPNYKLEVRGTDNNQRLGIQPNTATAKRMHLAYNSYLSSNTNWYGSYAGSTGMITFYEEGVYQTNVGGIGFNIDRIASDNTAVGVNPAPKMIITTDSKVGIGTAAPATPLHVWSTSYPQFRVSYNSALYFTLDHAATLNVYGNDWYVRLNGSEKFRIKQDGKIGIGTNNPLNILTLHQAAGANIRFQNATTGRYFIVGEGVGANDKFSFRGNSYRSTDTLTVDFTNNRVGVNNISPATTLDVDGTGNFTSALTGSSTITSSTGTSSAGNFFGTGNGSNFVASTHNATGIFGHFRGERAGTPKYYLGLDASDNFAVLDSGANRALTIDTAGGTKAATFFGDVKAAQFYTGYDWTTRSGGLNIGSQGLSTGAVSFFDGTLASSASIYRDSSSVFFVGARGGVATTGMAIDTNGNVGIGDSTPNYKLDVNGTGRFTGTLTAAGATFNGVVLPSADGTYNLGDNTTRWATIFADTFYGNGANITSLTGSNISSGTVAAARLGSGSSITSKFLRGDNTWQTVSSGSGDITEVIAGTTLSGGGASGSVTINHASHTGEVTGSGSLTIAGNVVDEANLKVSNSPTNGYVLTARSGNTGGMTWEAASGGGGDTVSITTSADDILSVSSGAISGVDAGSSDKIVFWDNSQSKLTYLAASTGLYTNGTNLKVTSAVLMAIQDTNYNYCTPASNTAGFYQGGSITVVASGSGVTFSDSTSSDYRLKSNISTFNSEAWTKVKSVNLRRFDFDESLIDPNSSSIIDTVGFIAHELAEAGIEGAVEGAKDEVDSDGNPVYQKVCLVKLVPVMWGALKEAITKIETLETKVQTLENS